MRALERERKARLEAEAANLRSQQEIAEVSHELRAALNGITGWSELLLAGDLPAADTLAAAAAIHRQALRQARLLNDLLEASHATFGAGTMQRAPVDMTAVVASAVAAMRPAADAAGIQVDTMTIDAARIMGDAERLEQVLTNLLDNALKFAETGGSVHVGLSAGHGTVTIQVSNSGAGIEPEFLPYVFDRFRHRDASPRRSQKGLGLGLSIARDIVKRHGGSIDVKSGGPGLGATFTVSLPTTTTEAPTTIPIDAMAISRSSIPPRQEPVRGGQRDPRGTAFPPVILVVDNDRDTLALYERVLCSAGFAVSSAREAVEALEYARAQRPDAILTDLRLPGPMSGAELVREIRMDAGLQAIPIVAITAQTPIELAALHMPTTVLLKPVSPRALLSHMEAIFGRTEEAPARADGP